MIGQAGEQLAGVAQHLLERAVREAKNVRTCGHEASREWPGGRSSRRRIGIPCQWARGPRSCVAGGGSPRTRAPPCRCGRSRRTPRRRLLRARGSTRPAAPCGCTPARPPEGSRPFARPTHHGCYRGTSKAPRLGSGWSSLTGDLGTTVPHQGVSPSGTESHRGARVIRADDHPPACFAGGRPCPLSRARASSTGASRSSSRSCAGAGGRRGRA